MIPDFQSIMLPLLEITGDKKEHTIQEVRDSLAKNFSLSEEERSKILSKSKQKMFANRVGWARTYLKKAGLLEYCGVGSFVITEQGLKVLQEKPLKINVKYLKRFPELLEFIKPPKKIVHPKDKDIELILEKKHQKIYWKLVMKNYRKNYYLIYWKKLNNVLQNFLRD